MANFPHPVLGNRDDYNDSSFFKITIEKRQRNPKGKEGFLILKNISYELNNKKLEQLIEEKDIDVYCEITCKGISSFSKFLKLTKKPITFEIEQNKLRDKVEIIPKIIANKDIDDLVFEDTKDIFKNRKFQISKGDLIAEGDILWFIHKPPFDEDISSEYETIIKFISDPETDVLTYTATEEGITIILPEAIDTHYQFNKDNRPAYVNMMYCVNVIQNILRDSLEGRLEDFEWKKTVQNDIKSFGLEEESDGQEFLELAQKIVLRSGSEASYVSAAEEVGQ